MKLTDEQVEIERVKFEQYYAKFYRFNDGDMYNLRDGAGYVGEWNNTYLGWLACRESNNEIEIPNINDSKTAAWKIAHNRFKSIIESQGYTVKSQE